MFLLSCAVPACHTVIYRKDSVVWILGILPGLLHSILCIGQDTAVL